MLDLKDIIMTTFHLNEDNGIDIVLGPDLIDGDLLGSLLYEEFYPALPHYSHEEMRAIVQALDALADGSAYIHTEAVR